MRASRRRRADLADRPMAQPLTTSCVVTATHDSRTTRPTTTVPCNANAMNPFCKERKTSVPYQTINPFTEKLVKTFPEQTDEQLQSIIAQAEDTYSNDWSKRSLADRKKILKNAVKIFREKREEFAQYITLEMGKLL